MSRVYNYLQDKYKGLGLSESELWTVLFCSAYALKELYNKYSNNCGKHPIRITSLCHDGRRIPTIRKHLKKINLLNPGCADDNLDPDVTEVEKILPSLSSKEPEFNTSGYIEKGHYSYEKEYKPITDLGEVYVDLDSLDAHEVIHVYLNQQLYDFREFKVTRTHTNIGRRYSGPSTTYTNHYLKIYPLNSVNPSIEASIIAAGETFAKSHTRETLSAAFNLKFRAIKDTTKDFWTTESISEDIEEVEEQIRLLQRTRKELLVLQAKTTTLGNEALKQLTIETGIKYIKRKAPLWMNSDDREKKKLAMLVLKGVSINTEVNV